MKPLGKLSHTIKQGGFLACLNICSLLYIYWARLAGSKQCWKHTTAEQCLQSIKISLSHSGTPASRLRVFKRLGGDMVGTADPHWPKGISHHNKHKTVGKVFLEVVHCLRYWLGISLLVVSAGFYITCFLPPPYETVFFLTQEIFFPCFCPSYSLPHPTVGVSNRVGTYLPARANPQRDA